MFKSGVQKLSGALFFSYTLGFAILFLWSLIFPSYRVLAGFFVHTAFLQGLLLFLENLIPIHAAGILITYSLLLGRETGKPLRDAADFRSIVSPAAMLLVFLTLCFTAIVIWVKPAVVNGINENVTKSVIARNYFDRAKDAYNVHDYKNAASYVRYSLSMEPSWKEAQALDRTIRRNYISETESAAEKKSIQKEGSGVNPFTEQSEGMTVDQVMERARAYYNAGNYYTSYYYATLAQKLDPGRTDARTLAIDSVNKMTTNELDSSEKEARAYLKRKQDGYEALLSRDYVAAYYIFNELAKTNPHDKEVSEYLNKSKIYVNKLSFFKDEVENIEAFPGFENILFLNRETPSFSEFVLIGKMIESREGTYFKDVEAIKVSEGGAVLSHFKAPFGKYMHAAVLKEVSGNADGVSDHFINLSCMDRTNPGERFVPVYLTREGGERLLANYLGISPSPQELKNYRLGIGLENTAGLTNLIDLKISSALERRGYSTFELDNNLLVRIADSFAFLVFSLLCVAIGWLYRSRYLGRPPVLSFFFIPAFPFILALFVELYLFMSAAISGLALMLFGFMVALIVTLAAQGFFVVVSFLIVAGKVSE